MELLVTVRFISVSKISLGGNITDNCRYTTRVLRTKISLIIWEQCIPTEFNNWWMSYDYCLYLCVCGGRFVCSPFMKYSSITACCLWQRIACKDKRHVCSDLNVNVTSRRKNSLSKSHEINIKRLDLNACCVRLPQRIYQSAIVLQKDLMF